jgi:molybdopterin-containing oxidoreductase family iron-sulfur binding subunit
MKKYWKTIEESTQGPDALKLPELSELPQKQEIIDFLESDGENLHPSRRDFLKFVGFGFATAAVLSSCKNPVNKAIPYLIKPEDVTPGTANHYASTYFEGGEYNSILVKVRDGRPIKIEGNDLSPISKGGTSAKVQASVFSLYDDGGRIKTPHKKNAASTWAEVDTDILRQLQQISAANGKIAILTATIISPSTLELIREFQVKYPGTTHVTYDAISASAILQANQLNFGKQAIPAMNFEAADVIVGFNADFLGTWISPVEFARQYAATRRLSESKKSMSKHYQFESTMTLSGSSADYRFSIKPSQEKLILANLYNEIAVLAGSAGFNTPPSPLEVKSLATELWASRGKSIIVCGSNDVKTQMIVNGINYLLGNYGSTIDLEKTMYTRKGIDEQVIAFANDFAAGKVDALLCYQVNPVFDFPEPAKFAEGLKKAKLSVSFASAWDETAKLSQYVCPTGHYLESWNDAEPRKGQLSLAQPAINKLFDTRDFQDSLLKWAGIADDYHTYIQKYWEKSYFPLQNTTTNFQAFWNKSLQAGVFEYPSEASAVTAISSIEAAFGDLGSTVSGTEVYLYESVAMGNGSYGNNPWLQELPDPVSKVTWDNYVALSPKMAAEMTLAEGDIVKINDKVELPVLLQPGQAYGVVAIALGYGHTEVGPVGNAVGGNAHSLLALKDGTIQYWNTNVKLAKTGGKHNFAKSQEYQSMEGRPLIRETSLGEWKVNPGAGNELHEEFVKNKVTLYPELEFPIHHWGLVVDLNTCTGCSACVIACQAENNIPVIGKEEVRLKRDMHWIRIDRYYVGEAEDPNVVFQPVMCQHCDNAPCENVCPVAATTHSSEGMNQMSYNRCIGTKYCINNCPYKVRRFNWYRYADNKEFPYGTENELGKMVLNPDVVVRERGVVEKCSFCIQRVQESKQTAKLEGRPVRNGEVQTACMQSCPPKALMFGDRNDPNSDVSKALLDPRNYNLLEELHTLPGVSYMTKVRNQESQPTEEKA